MTINQKIAEEHCEADNLIKEATKQKHVDIEKAIDLIRRAIKIRPQFLIDDYFKLANYLFISGKNDEAFSVYAELVLKADIKDKFFYNLNLSSVYNKMALQVFREEKYEDFLYYYTLTLINDIIGLASQGRAEIYIERYSQSPTFDLFFQFNQTKVNKSFKKLGVETNKQSFLFKFDKYLKGRLNSIIELNESAKGINLETYLDEYLLKEKGNPEDQTNNAILGTPMKDPKTFYKKFIELNSDNYSEYFNQYIIPLLSSS